MWWIASLCILLVGSCTRPTECIPSLEKNYIGNTDLIAVVQIQADNSAPEIIQAAVKKVFKGVAEGNVIFDAKASDFTFSKEQEYLVYAKRDEAKNRYIVEKCSRTKTLKEASSDMAFLSQNIKCIDERLIHNNACYMIYAPVCGCDNKTYGNACEARRKGIAIYTSGECEDAGR